MNNYYTCNKIPYILYKTGPFNYIPDEINDIIKKNCVMLNIKNVRFFNDEMCRQFIKINFNSLALKAYDILIPTAYKADLFRLCVLYINGGIYGDLTQEFLINFDVNQSRSHLILVKDRPFNYIQISFIATIPKNAFLMYTINKICYQILNKNKGNNPLDITGPCAVGRHFTTFFNIPKITMGKHEYIGEDSKKYIVDIPFKEVGGFLTNSNETIKCIKTKISNHHQLLYNKKYNYSYQWQHNIIFNNL